MTNAPAPTTVRKAERPARSGKGGSVVATPYEIAKLTDLCALLSERPAVFPKAVGEPVLPLAIGTLDALKAIAQPETSDAQLKGTLRAYATSLGYLLAQGRPGAQRHDLAGVPIEPVSDEHRKGAQERFAAVRARRDRLREARRQQVEASAAEPDKAPAGA